jgi:hypothetical protein
MKTQDSHRTFIEKASNDAREYLQSLFEENQRLNNLVAELEVSSREFAERYVEVELQNTNLANLYVASYQLNGTLDRTRILQAIQEIIINLVGCEELAIWETDEELGALTLTSSFGIDSGAWACIPIGAGLIGSVASSGIRYIAKDDPNPIPEITACIPLKLDDRVVGVIGIFRLLQQKQGLEPIDFELFDLLASHAATSLFCTRLVAGADAVIVN